MQSTWNLGRAYLKLDFILPWQNLGQNLGQLHEGCNTGFFSKSAADIGTAQAHTIWEWGQLPNEGNVASEGSGSRAEIGAHIFVGKDGKEAISNILSIPFFCGRLNCLILCFANADTCFLSPPGFPFLCIFNAREKH